MGGHSAGLRHAETWALCGSGYRTLSSDLVLSAAQEIGIALAPILEDARQVQEIGIGLGNCTASEVLRE